jgi:hypothetical protein
MSADIPSKFNPCFPRRSVQDYEVREQEAMTGQGQLPRGLSSFCGSRSIPALFLLWMDILLYSHVTNTQRYVILFFRCKGFLANGSKWKNGNLPCCTATQIMNSEVNNNPVDLAMIRRRFRDFNNVGSPPPNHRHD